MGVKTSTVSNVADVFLTLPREEQEEIFHIGATFRLLDLRKRLSRAQENVERFETKYSMTLEELESKGLPEDADYEMHEDYIEWHYWARVREKTQNTLDVLMGFSKQTCRAAGKQASLLRNLPGRCDEADTPKTGSLS